MTISTGISGATSDSRAKSRLLIILSIAAISAVSVMLTSRTGTVTDVSWIIGLIKRMESGQRLYVDIMETNPPFSIWLYYPIVKAANWSSVTPELAIAICAYCAVIFGFGLTVLIAHRGGLVATQARWWVWPAILATLLLLPAGAFAQREHIGTALLLPLLAVMAWRHGEMDRNRVSVSLAVIAGIAGSVMIVVKPHWALAIALPVFYTALSRRSLRVIFTIENFIIGAVALTYLASVIIIHPQFFQTMYPMLRDLYLPIRIENSAWLPIATPFVVALSVWALRRIKGPISSFADISAIAAVGFFIALMILGKGWSYHRYPSTAAALIASIIALDEIFRIQAGKGLYRFGCVVLAGLAFARPIYQGVAQGNKVDSPLLHAVRSQHPAPLIGTVGADIGLAYPFVRQVNGRFDSAYCSDWAGAHAFLRLRRANASLTDAEKRRLNSFLADYMVMKIDEFHTRRPDIIIVQKSSAWVEFLYEQAGFRQVMADYQLLAENQDVSIWNRAPVVDPI
ncbi:MAG: hypothetical protein NXI27_13225 [Alphaproteobacteria bacterium]|nr:hypothetical protein [Alphaproteobacteria bacterium]